jgi:hypothetical protein
MFKSLRTRAAEKPVLYPLYYLRIEPSLFSTPFSAVAVLPQNWPSAWCLSQDAQDGNSRFPRNVGMYLPCGGDLEYLYRDPALQSQRHIKWQIRPLVGEGAPQKQDRNCQRSINIWSWTQMGVCIIIYWLTVSRNVTWALTCYRRVLKQQVGVRWSPACEEMSLVARNLHWSRYGTYFTVHYTDEQHAMSSHELQSALMLTVEFSKMYYTR